MNPSWGELAGLEAGYDESTPEGREANFRAQLREEALIETRAHFRASGQWMPGVCRFCGCTAANACERQDGQPCGWHNQDRTVCNAEECVDALVEELLG